MSSTEAVTQGHPACLSAGKEDKIRVFESMMYLVLESSITDVTQPYLSLISGDVFTITFINFMPC